MIKVLLDENLPVKLKYRLQEVCEIYTVRDKGWNSLENGSLLQSIESEGFDFLITSDKNIQHQQNIKKYSFGFIIINTINNNYETIFPLLGNIKKTLTRKNPGKITIIN